MAPGRPGYGSCPRESLLGDARGADLCARVCVCALARRVYPCLHSAADLFARGSLRREAIGLVGRSEVSDRGG